MADRFSVMKRFDFKTPVKIFIKCAAAAVLSSAFILSGCSDKSAVSSDALPEIIIGSDEYEPYNFSDKNGNPAGIDVEIASEAFLRMGYKAQFKNIVWDEKDEMLTTGKVDCLWGCFSMNGREDKYRWQTGCSRQSRQQYLRSVRSQRKKSCRAVKLQARRNTLTKERRYSAGKRTLLLCQNRIHFCRPA